MRKSIFYYQSFVNIPLFIITVTLHLAKESLEGFY